MNISKSRAIFFVILINCAFITAQQKKAFCAVPIADCCCHSLTVLFESQDEAEERYTNLPLSGQSGRHACPRDQQMLAHEIVTIVDEIGDECEIQASHLFYLDPDFPIYKKCNFWSLKKNLIYFDELKKRGINPEHYLPKPITTGKKLIYDGCVTTIILPFNDPVTQQIYSVGTRFLIADQTETLYTVWVFDPNDKQFKQTMISRSHCIINAEKSHEERLHDFVALLRIWANNQNGFIPFVWGGSSAREFYAHDEFYEKNDYQAPYPISYWVRDNATTTPHAGFDASSLVFRAAQSVGIPYFCKNTLTAHAHLRALNNQDTLLEGDVLWLPSGLVVISDIQNNKVIAACGYQTGHGKVIECALSEFFKNIHTFDELLTAYTNKTPLECCNKDGIITKLFDDWTILKLPND